MSSSHGSPKLNRALSISRRTLADSTERWLDALVQAGLVAILVENDVRVVRLTTQGKASMDTLFASAQAGTAVS